MSTLPLRPQTVRCSDIVSPNCLNQAATRQQDRTNFVNFIRSKKTNEQQNQTNNSLQGVGWGRKQGNIYTIKSYIYFIFPFRKI